MDTIDNKLKTLVCNGSVTLTAARQAIAADWVAVGPTTTPVSSPGDRVSFRRSADAIDWAVHTGRADAPSKNHIPSRMVNQVVVVDAAAARQELFDAGAQASDVDPAATGHLRPLPQPRRQQLVAAGDRLAPRPLI
ncbi:MAG TPA: hypothetical protein VJT31_05920 [Rugosimonospora sp.]|nr:hypothetical protein [Rugosimonospora sp.]